MVTLPRVHGRDTLLAALRECCQGALVGHSSVVLVEGRPGLGKTRILQAAAEIARSLGLRAGYGLASSGDNAVPMNPLFTALFDGSPPLVDPGERSRLHYLPEQRYWLLEELESLFERAAMAHPLLVAIDDVQWADSGSLLALRTLPARLASLPIVWIVAIRAEPLRNEVRRSADRLVEAGALPARLTPLDEAAVAKVVADLVCAAPDPALLTLAQRAQGSPFLLAELIHGLQEESLVRMEDGQAVLVASRLPARVGESMRDRLAHMPELVRRVAQTASALTRSFSFDQLAAMTGEPAASLLAPVEHLLAADLLVEADGQLSFGHDLLREWVRGTLPVTALRALQRQAVDTLQKTGAPAVEIATQLADSAEPGDDAAVETLHQAARALAASDAGAAANLSLRAVTIASPHYPERVALVAETALHLHAAGRIAEGKEFADSVLRQALTAEQEARVLLSIANMFGLSADQRADADIRALALAGVSDLTRTRHLATLVHNRTTGGRSAAAAELAPTVRGAVDRTGDATSKYTLELAESGLRYLSGEFETALDRVEASARTGAAVGEPLRMVIVQYWHSEVLSVLDRHTEALQFTAANLTLAQADRQVWGALLFESGRGRHLMQMGRLDDASAALEPAVEMAEAVPLAGVLDMAAAVARGVIAIHTGDIPWLQRCLAYTESLRGGGTPAVERHAAWLSALAAMAREDSARARADVSALIRPDQAGLEARIPHDVTDEIDITRVALACGDASLCDLAVASAQTRSDRNPRVPTLAGVAAHCRGLRDDSRGDLDVAIKAFAVSPRPLALASALEDAGRLSAQQGDTDSAIAHLDRALEAYAGLGATWDVARVRGRLRRLGIRRRLPAAGRPRSGWAGLTESELSVARLVASGLTNREVAERLYLSVHTVSSHLRSSFTKLDIRSRTELANIVAGEAKLSGDQPGPALMTATDPAMATR
jgi:DNA-binding CsgD family transcriptional regulator